MKNVVQNFNKYEPHLRDGLTKFMQRGDGLDALNSLNKRYYQLAIYNLP